TPVSQARCALHARTALSTTALHHWRLVSTRRRNTIALRGCDRGVMMPHHRLWVLLRGNAAARTPLLHTASLVMASSSQQRVCSMHARSPSAASYLLSLPCPASLFQSRPGRRSPRA